MPDWSHYVARIITAASVTLLAACGQTGPLYLPAKPGALSTPAVKTAPLATDEIPTTDKPASAANPQ